MNFVSPFSSTLQYSVEDTMNTSSFALYSSSSSSSSSSNYSLPSSSSSSSASSSESTIAEKVGMFVGIIVTFTLAAVSSIIGGVTGGLMGLMTENGVLRGTALGAISGAVVTIDAIDSSLPFWLTDQSEPWSLSNMMDIACSILSGRLVREKVGQNMQSAVERQMHEVDLSLMEDMNIFDIGGTEGLPSESIDKIPRISITSENIMDAEEERVSCVVCLQDFEIGEEVRSLPHCQHMFHLPCIDGWLIRHGSCPLCRWNI